MNSKIIASISIIITIGVIGFSVTQIQFDSQQENRMQETDPDNPMLEKIAQDKITNDNANQPYIPKEREWNSIGPFSIDRSEYVLGEKIFVNIDTLTLSDKGTMIFFIPVNDTSYKAYYSMPFDGSRDRNNFYFTPDLSIARGICDKTQLVGNWKVIFEGTNYPDLEFKVIDRILPGEVYRYGNMEDANDIGIEFEQKC